MKPFVGLPVIAEGVTCSHSVDLDQPKCQTDAARHIAVQSEAWGVVGLLTCDEHDRTARSTGTVVDEHPVGPLCRFPSGECWSV